MNDVIVEELVQRGLIGSSEAWIAVAYVLCMFVVAAFRPQQIANPVYFRLSYLIFAMYFVLPTLAQTLIWWMFNVGNQGAFRRMGNLNQLRMDAFILVIPLLGKICLGLSIALGLGSLRQTAYIPPPYRDH